MASKKLGSIGIIIVILFFMISSLSYFYLNLDENTGLNTISSNIEDLQSSTDDATSNYQEELKEKIDDSGEFVQPDDLQVETRGSDSAGIINAKGKNVLTSFITTVFSKFSIPQPIQIFLFGIISITISILFIRFFWGDSRV